MHRKSASGNQAKYCTQPKAGLATFYGIGTEEIRKSIETLDRILDQYDSGNATKDRILDQYDSGNATKELTSEKKLIPQKADRAAHMLASCMQAAASHKLRKRPDEDLPPPPPDLLTDTGCSSNSLPDDTTAERVEMTWARARCPPAVPKRGPDTRLSSTSSSSESSVVSLPVSRDGDDQSGPPAGRGLMESGCIPLIIDSIFAPCHDGLVTLRPPDDDHSGRNGLDRLVTVDRDDVSVNCTSSSTLDDSVSPSLAVYLACVVPPPPSLTDDLVRRTDVDLCSTVDDMDVDPTALIVPPPPPPSQATTGPSSPSSRSNVPPSQSTTSTSSSGSVKLAPPTMPKHSKKSPGLASDPCRALSPTDVTDTPRSDVILRGDDVTVSQLVNGDVTLEFFPPPPPLDDVDLPASARDNLPPPPPSVLHATGCTDPDSSRRGGLVTSETSGRRLTNIITSVSDDGDGEGDGVSNELAAAMHVARLRAESSQPAPLSLSPSLSRAADLSLVDNSDTALNTDSLPPTDYTTMPLGRDMTVGLHSPDGSLSVDVTQLPGYQQVPANCPQWKKAVIDKKNKQLEEDAMRELLARKHEEERWRDIPQWKKALILEKEKKKQEEMAPYEMERRRQDSEMERLQSLPEWKRNLIVKKRTGDVI